MTAPPASPPPFHPFNAADGPVEYPEAHEGSFADIVERLFRAFEDRLPLRDIVGVVKESREHLRGSPIGALPELTERLAHERLNALCLAKQPTPALPISA